MDFTRFQGETSLSESLPIIKEGPFKEYTLAIICYLYNILLRNSMKEDIVNYKACNLMNNLKNDIDGNYNPQKLIAILPSIFWTVEVTLRNLWNGRSTEK